MDLMARYDDNHFDLAIVDPPYGINKDGGKIGGAGKNFIGKLVSPKEYKKKEWDKESPKKKYFNELIRVSKNQIIFGANHFISKIPYDSSCWIVWDKENFGKFADCELAWTSFKSSVKLFRFRIHPTQKPVRLYEWILMNYAKEGYKILDTHLGSGSIAIACHNLGYDLTACELDKEYYNAAMKRIKEHQSQLRII